VKASNWLLDTAVLTRIPQYRPLIHGFLYFIYFLNIFFGHKSGAKGAWRVVTYEKTEDQNSRDTHPLSYMNNTTVNLCRLCHHALGLVKRVLAPSK
jgi:hypothetical protein